MNKNDQRVVTAMRVLTAEAIQKANSGHPGLAIGSAAAAFTLWKQMKYNPKDLKWPARDRFVLSSGHASMLEYSLMHFFGCGISIEDIKNFRQCGSRTPGHPDYRDTEGVEATTGPLGQGFGMAVGMAMAEAHQAAVYNREGFPIVDNYTYVIMGDGCMMEGAASEAASMAGNMKLGKLIALYDSNQITIEGKTEIAFTEDVKGRYEAYGWHVQDVADGEDMDAIAKALENARAEKDRPSLIIYHTIIGRGTPNQGLPKVHGEPLGQDNIDAMKKELGWDYAPFEIPSDVYDYMSTIIDSRQAAEDEWNAMFKEYEKAYPELAAQWKACQSGKIAVDLVKDADFWKFEGKAASRASSGDVLNRLNERLPNLFGGSADLQPSNKTKLNGESFFGPDDYSGKMIHFGVREQAMTCACNGIALYGGMIPFCATFFVFSDYVKPMLRLTALMEQRVLFILTHDSIGVGEDGPTHQPIEQLAALRAIPHTIVFRPADAKEVAAGYVAALNAKGPTVLALTRQNLPLYEKSGADALKGGYIIRDCEGTPDVILLASGSEVEPAYNAADLLAADGIKARVVSVPSMELFDAQDAAYKEKVLPDAVRARVAVEAGTPSDWYRYVGLDGAVIGMTDFGESGPQAELFKKYGFTAEHVAEVAKSVIR